MTTPARLRATIRSLAQRLPLPASAIALAAAFLLGTLDYNNAGWLLFGIGVIAWIKLDARHLLQSDRHGLPPALALLAYPVLAGPQANASVTFALALHALVVFLILLSRRLAEDVGHPLLANAHQISHQKVISRSI
jgi:hypothetical protein